MRGLYAIIDVETLETHGLDPLRFGEALCEARPAALQVREKRHRTRATLALLRALAPLCRAGGVRLFANDRPDLAALARCDGVHLGQEDLPPSEARKVMRALAGSEMMVGMSAHDRAELEVALGEHPDYLAFGPVFGTRSKRQPAPTLGLDGLAGLTREARRRLDVPVVAIGSIDEERAAAIAPSADAAAVIRALVAPEASDPYAEARRRARAIAAAFEGRT